MVENENRRLSLDFFWLKLLEALTMVLDGMVEIENS